MKAECTLSIEFEDVATAKKVLRSIMTDDQGFVKSSLKGNILEATIQSSSVASLLHTLDDYLACVSVAKDIVNKH
jgi:tRNA threonylcarbamoyladenosine modification (KEOPS) complex  Pcc1 subunit